MLCFKSSTGSCTFLFAFSLFCLFVLSNSTAFSYHSLRSPGNVEILGEGYYSGVQSWNTRRSLADQSTGNTSMVLAETRSSRRDPLDNFKNYRGGWNISNKHYWASVSFTAAPFFIIAVVWFVLFGLSLSLICLCYCCCPREPYGYSRVAYALSLILLILFTLAAIAGCIVLYTGQGKFYGSTSDTLDYVVNQANFTVENLRNVSGYLDAAKRIGVDSMSLPGNVQQDIDGIQTKINSSAVTLATTTQDNSEKIQDVLNGMRLALIILAAVMLLLAFIGFLLSVFGLTCLVYTLVIAGWILVTGTFILCGVFLLLHNVVADTCVSMDEWVMNPTAHTALDDILPCVDNATAQETLTRSKEVTYQLSSVVNTVLSNIANRNYPPNVGPLYYNQSGPLVPLLCNPYHPDFTDRGCASGEVSLGNATEVWESHVCEVSSSGICKTIGRLTPKIYNQMAASVNVSYGLYRYGPFLVNLEDCTFVRQTFTDISNDHCPGLRKFTQWIYIGLVMVSAAVMLSLIFWVIYARERRHRVYTKHLMNTTGEEFKAS